MTARLHEGDRVRHACFPTEGVVETVDDASPIPTVTVRMESGVVVVDAREWWWRVPGCGAVGWRER